MIKTLAHHELATMDVPISYRRFKDICVQGFVAEYCVVNQDPTFDIGRTDRCRTQGATCVLDGLSCNDEPRERSLRVLSP